MSSLYSIGTTTAAHYACWLCYFISIRHFISFVVTDNDDTTNHSCILLLLTTLCSTVRFSASATRVLSPVSPFSIFIALLLTLCRLCPSLLWLVLASTCNFPYLLSAFFCTTIMIILHTVIYERCRHILSASKSLKFVYNLSIQQ